MNRPFLLAGVALGGGSRETNGFQDLFHSHTGTAANVCQDEDIQSGTPCLPCPKARGLKRIFVTQTRDSSLT